MISLKKLFGKEDKFYDLLEASADEAHVSVKLLCRYLEQRRDKQKGSSLDEFIQSRRKDKMITQKITEELSKTFVTPIEREDIEVLSLSLYRVPKMVEKVVERISIHPSELNVSGLLKQAMLIEKAAEQLVFMVHQLRKGSSVSKINEAQDRLQWAEGEADKVMLQLINDLYHSDCSAKEMVMMKDLYEMMEKVIDRCRDSGNEVLQIVLKYS